MKRPVGWYLLPHSGVPYFGPIPEGVEECDPPTSAAPEQPVDGSESVTGVNPGALVDEQPAKSKQVRRRPASRAASEDVIDGEGEVDGQDEDGTP